MKKYLMAAVDADNSQVYQKTIYVKGDEYRLED